MQRWKVIYFYMSGKKPRMFQIETVEGFYLFVCFKEKKRKNTIWKCYFCNQKVDSQCYAHFPRLWLIQTVSAVTLRPQKTKQNYVLTMAISQTHGHFKMSSGKPGAEFPSLVAPSLASAVIRSRNSHDSDAKKLRNTAQWLCGFSPKWSQGEWEHKGKCCWPCGNRRDHYHWDSNAFQEFLRVTEESSSWERDYILKIWYLTYIR